MTTTGHLNHVHFMFSDNSGGGSDDGDLSAATNLYTPGTGKVFEPRHIIISWTGDALASVDIYDDTDGTNEKVFAFNYTFNADDNGHPQTIHMPIEGFYFSKAFRVVATANKVNMMVSGILW